MYYIDMEEFTVKRREKLREIDKKMRELLLKDCYSGQHWSVVLGKEYELLRQQYAQVANSIFNKQ